MLWKPQVGGSRILRSSNEYPILTPELESEYREKHGILIKMSPTFKDNNVPGVYLFKDIQNQDIIKIQDMTDTFAIFKSSLVFPRLKTDELNYIKEKYFGFIEQVADNIMRRYLKETSFEAMERSYAYMDFEMFGVSGISILIQAMGVDKIDKIYDIVLTHDRDYVRQLAYFASRFSGLDEQFMEQSNRRVNKTKIRKQLHPDEEYEDANKDPAAEYKKNKYRKYKDQIDESSEHLKKEMTKASMNRYRKPSIDFDKQIDDALMSGAITPKDIEGGVETPVHLFDPRGLTKGTLIHDVLVKRRANKPSKGSPPSNRSKDNKDEK